MKRNVRFYETVEGRCPVREFIDSLPGKVAQKVVWTLSLLEDMEILPVVYFKKLVNTDDIWEVRYPMAPMPIESSAFLPAIHLSC